MAINYDFSFGQPYITYLARQTSTDYEYCKYTENLLSLKSGVCFMDTKGRLFGYKVVFTVPSIELRIQSKMFF